MRYLKLSFIFSVVLLGLLASCSSDKTEAVAGDKANADSVARAGALTIQRFPEFKNDPGLLGVMVVPEMLSLCKMDSAKADMVATKMKDDFLTLDEDMSQLGAQMDGPQGVIYYNSDPNNFKFECVVLIDKMPAKKPQHSKIVVLEASDMIVYNYYGPYEGTYTTYDEIRQYCAIHGLEQSGPMREFYPAVSATADTSKWLTRILVPVSKKK